MPSCESDSDGEHWARLQQAAKEKKALGAFNMDGKSRKPSETNHGDTTQSYKFRDKASASRQTKTDHNADIEQKLLEAWPERESITDGMFTSVGKLHQLTGEALSPGN